MPFNGTTHLVEAIWAFVDQYDPGDTAMRSGFDQFLADLIASINSQSAYVQTLIGSNPDARYLGRKAVVPTLRDDATVLQAGDWYISSAAPAGRVNLSYVYTGANFIVMSDFGSVGATGASLVAAANQATARGVLGLGSAALQSDTAFAPASVAADVALALKLADSSGLAKAITGPDWDNAHSVGPGTCFLQGSAATSNAPAAVNLSGMYVAYDVNNGFILLTDHANGAMYMRRRIASAWGTWRELASVPVGSVPGDMIYKGAGGWDRLGPGAKGQLVRQNAALNAPEWGAAKQPSNVATTTSGTTHDLTGVPTTANYFTLHSYSVSLSGSDTLLVQLLNSGGTPITAGYTGTASTIDAASVASAASPSSAFSVFQGANAENFTGRMNFARVPGTNLWVQDHTGRRGGVITVMGGGRIDAGGDITGLRLLASGANTFDAGSAWLSWEAA